MNLLDKELLELAAQNAVMREALKISDICLANAEMDESEDVRVQNAVALSLPQPAALREIEAMRLDAERYHFVKEWFELIVCNADTEDEYTEIAFGCKGPTDLLGTFNSIDSAIDAAMAAAVESLDANIAATKPQG